jgi:hypothetical protein
LSKFIPDCYRQCGVPLDQRLGANENKITMYDDSPHDPTGEPDELPASSRDAPAVPYPRCSS